MNSKLCASMLLLSLATAAIAQDKGIGWQPDPQLQAALAKKGIAWRYHEEDVKTYVLPDPLLALDHSTISTAQQWETHRRPELLDLFTSQEYGYSPAKPAKVTVEILAVDDKAMEGRATMKRAKITSSDAAGKSFSFEAALLVPNGAKSPSPAFLLINNRPLASADATRKQKNDFWPAEEIIARGYATAVFRTNDVDPDQKDESARAEGVRGAWPAGGGHIGSDSWATIGAWAWGASRVLDWLETEPAVDAKHVAVIGHSRGGKTALWAGAQDIRFAMVIANGSGRGGGSLARRRFGESIQAINTSFPYWFCDNYKKYNGHEDDLPFDQHELLALIAPRPLAIGDADADFWADQRGEFLSLANAAPVYALYSIEGFKPDEMPALESRAIRGHTAFLIRHGVHNLTPVDWKAYMDFADGVRKR